MQSITSEKTIEKFQESFTTHGLPEILVIDNGTSFTSELFQVFVNTNGICHICSTPYHTATNALAEVRPDLQEVHSLVVPYSLDWVVFYSDIQQHPKPPQGAPLLSCWCAGIWRVCWTWLGRSYASVSRASSSSKNIRMTLPVKSENSRKETACTIATFEAQVPETFTEWFRREWAYETHIGQPGRCGSSPPCRSPLPREKRWHRGWILWPWHAKEEWPIRDCHKCVAKLCGYSTHHHARGYSITSGQARTAVTPLREVN